MNKEEKYISKCCNKKPVWIVFTAGFNFIGRTLICPKCRSCCVLKTKFNLK